MYIWLVHKKLLALNDDSNLDSKKDAIRGIFHDIMHHDEIKVKSQIEKIISRLRQEQKHITQDEESESVPVVDRIGSNGSNKRLKQENDSRHSCHNDPTRISQLMLKLNQDFPVCIIN